MTTEMKEGSVSFPFSKIGLSKCLSRRTSQYVSVLLPFNSSMFYNRFSFENLKIEIVRKQILPESMLVNKFKVAFMFYLQFIQNLILIIELNGFLYIAFQNLSSNYVGEENIKCSLKVANSVANRNVSVLPRAENYLSEICFHLTSNS